MKTPSTTKVGTLVALTAADKFWVPVPALTSERAAEVTVPLKL